MPHIIANPWVLRSPPHFIFVNGCAGVLVNGLPCNDALYAPCVEYSDTYSDGARFIHRLHKNENENENSYSCGPAQLKVGQVSYFHTPSPFSPFSFLLLPSSGNGQFRKLLCIFQNSCSLHLPGSPFSAPLRHLLLLSKACDSPRRPIPGKANLTDFPVCPTIAVSGCLDAPGLQTIAGIRESASGHESRA